LHAVAHDDLLQLGPQILLIPQFTQTTIKRSRVNREWAMIQAAILYLRTERPDVLSARLAAAKQMTYAFAKHFCGGDAARRFYEVMHDEAGSVIPPWLGNDDDA
jgi:hypothetical protein